MRAVALAFVLAGTMVPGALVSTASQPPGGSTGLGVYAASPGPVNMSTFAAGRSRNERTNETTAGVFSADNPIFLSER